MQNRESLEIARVKAFSDGVFAIAATLLAFNVHLVNQDELPFGALFDQLSPQISAFLISFVVAAIYWRNHNRLFNLLHRVDQRLNMLNMAQLAAVCLMPFASGLIAGARPSPGAITFYALSIAVIGLLSAALWAYAALKPELIGPSAAPAELWSWFRVACIPPAIFLLSIALVPFSVIWAMRSWSLLAVLLPVARRLSHR